MIIKLIILLLAMSRLVAEEKVLTGALVLEKPIEGKMLTKSYDYKLLSTGSVVSMKTSGSSKVLNEKILKIKFSIKLEDGLNVLLIQNIGDQIIKFEDDFIPVVLTKQYRIKAGEIIKIVNSEVEYGIPLVFNTLKVNEIKKINITKSLDQWFQNSRFLKYRLDFFYYYGDGKYSCISTPSMAYKHKHKHKQK